MDVHEAFKALEIIKNFPYSFWKYGIQGIGVQLNSFQEEGARDCFKRGFSPPLGFHLKIQSYAAVIDFYDKKPQQLFWEYNNFCKFIDNLLSTKGEEAQNNVVPYLCELGIKITKLEDRLSKLEE